MFMIFEYFTNKDKEIELKDFDDGRIQNVRKIGDVKKEYKRGKG